MKKMISVLAAAVMVISVVFSGSVMAAPDAELAGEWHIQSIKQGTVEMDASILSAMGMDMILTLNEDGTAAMNMVGVEELQEGSWSSDGEGGTITFGNELPFAVVDGNIVIEQDEQSMVFSRETAQAADVTLAPEIQGAQLADFNGTWNATVYAAFGMPLPLSILGAEISLTIEDGKVEVHETVRDPENDFEVIDSMDKELAAELTEDGKLFVDFGGENLLEKINMEASGMTLTLHEDGRMSGTTPEIIEAIESMKVLAEQAKKNAEDGPEEKPEETAEENDGQSSGSSGGESSEMSMEMYLVFERAE